MNVPVSRLGALASCAVLLFFSLTVMATTAPSAQALDALDVRGIINVSSDFGACGTVTFQTTQRVIAGEFSAAGIVGKGSNVTTQRNAVPIFAQNTNFVKVCFPGAGFTPTSGAVQYHLDAHGVSGDTSTVKQCLVNEPTSPFYCVHI